MKTENESCCFCFNIVSEGNTVDADILDLLKFLIANVNTSALENSTACSSCLTKILETCDYKTRNSSKMLMKTTKEADADKPKTCQKCEKVFEQEDTFLLVDCITQIDWSDFINYLFADQDSQTLKSSQICDSCRISITNIQDLLKLIYVYDQSKMKHDVGNHYEIKTIGNENLVEEKVEIKQEFENVFIDDKTGIENILFEDNKTEISNSDYINYDSFKNKNEELELKLENDYDDKNQSTYRYGKVDATEITSGGSINEEDEQGCSRLSYDKVQDSILHLKCIYCLKEFVNKSLLDNHLLRIHKCREGVTSKIHECDKCSYLTTKTSDMLSHKYVQHDIKTEGLDKYKCQNCTYESYYKNSLIRHIKMHNNIRDFKCTLCSKNFTQKNYLNDHLLKIHKSKDNVTSKVYECDQCSYETAIKTHLSRHKIKHGVKLEGFKKYKCQYCTYEAYNKNDVNRHIKMHQNIRDFKCTLCSKSFTERRNLDGHLLRIHKSKDNITSKIYECDRCSYSSTKKDDLSRHQLTHGIKVGYEKHKCQYCSYETYKKNNLNRHIKTHKI